MTFEELAEKYTDRELIEFVTEISNTDDYKYMVSKYENLGFKKGVGIGMVSDVNDPKASIWLIGQFLQVVQIDTGTEKGFIVSIEGQSVVRDFMEDFISTHKETIF